MTNKKTIQALFLFIFILLGKHISDLLACSVSNIINTHFIIKHFIGFFILYTTIISLETNKSLKELFINSFLIYIWFIITVKTTRRINISIIILLLITYFVYLYNEKLKQNKNDKNNKKLIKILDLYEKYIVYVLIILSAFGFIVYLGEKKIDFKENFSWKQFLFYRITDYNCNYTKCLFLGNIILHSRIFTKYFSENISCKFN